MAPIVRADAVAAAQAAAEAAAIGIANVRAPAKGMALTRAHYSPLATATAAAPAADAPAATATFSGAAPANPACSSNNMCSNSLFSEPSCNQKPVGTCGNGISYFSTDAIMKTPQLVPIFYGSWTPAQRQIVTNYLWGLSGSNWWAITKPYSDTTGFVNTAAKMYSGNSVVIPGTPMGASLTEMQLQSVVKAGIANLTGSASNGADNVIYILLGGSDVTADTYCSMACGWHSYIPQPNGVYAKYIFVGE